MEGHSKQGEEYVQRQRGLNKQSHVLRTRSELVLLKHKMLRGEIGEDGRHQVTPGCQQRVISRDTSQVI